MGPGSLRCPPLQTGTKREENQVGCSCDGAATIKVNCCVGSCEPVKCKSLQDESNVAQGKASHLGCGCCKYLADCCAGIKPHPRSLQEVRSMLSKMAVNIEVNTSSVWQKRKLMHSKPSSAMGAKSSSRLQQQWQQQRIPRGVGCLPLNHKKPPRWFAHRKDRLIPRSLRNPWIHTQQKKTTKRSIKNTQNWGEQSDSSSACRYWHCQISQNGRRAGWLSSGSPV